MKWIENQRRSGYIVTRNLIRIKAKAMASDQQISDFQATNSWCTRFLRRRNFVLRQKTKIAQKLPEDLEEKITSFHRFVIKRHKETNYKLVDIGNMDETPVWFDMPSARTVNARGERTVLVNTTGHEKSHFTVVLPCLADGTKLKPMVIFKRKTIPKEKFPAGVVVHCHPKGWMDEEGLKIWVQKVWKAQPGGLLRKKSLLIWYLFRAHLVDSVKRAVKETNTDIAVIPGGLTSVLQPLDVSLNKPFKDRLRDKWTTWMIEGQKEYTAGGNIKAASLNTMCEWVNESWKGLSLEMVSRSFKKCGISNAIDGSKDDILWEDDDEQCLSSLAAVDEDQVMERELAAKAVYDDRLTNEQWYSLFGDSDDEDEFDGF